uniref:Uncharacterized protein n=1 Tax=Anguilla anguilla TaxID=7936 RepID=A0A0E9RPW4_ANGAN
MNFHWVWPFTSNSHIICHEVIKHGMHFGILIKTSHKKCALLKLMMMP